MDDSRRHRTIIFCKPYRVLCSFTDREGRSTLADYIDLPDVYPAGRLDYDSEGLLLLTSDGKLAHLVTHPRFKLTKQYLVQVEHIPTGAALDELRRGVLVKGRRTRPADVELLSEEPDIFPRHPPIRYRKSVPTAWLKIGLREGRKRQVRHMTAAVGHPTLRLIRIAIGPVSLGNLQPGQWRDLTPTELRQLWAALRLPPGRKRPRK
ncbi:MAG: pseudouridine synthase [Chloroflexi bacterium]|nr:MAG: pseudouridine synthase [Chloroflexota bacterium]